MIETKPSTVTEAKRLSMAKLRNLLQDNSPHSYLYPPLQDWSRDELLTEMVERGILVRR